MIISWMFCICLAIFFVVQFKTNILKNKFLYAHAHRDISPEATNKSCSDYKHLVFLVVFPHFSEIAHSANLLLKMNNSDAFHS